MKKKILLTLITAAICILAFGAVGVSAATYGDLSYEILNNEVIITGCNKSATVVEIPKTIDNYPVTEIGSDAFDRCRRLTSVSIPDSVTKIGDYAFAYCSGLIKVNITDIKSWCNISFGDTWSNPLYYAKNLYINDNLITDLIIPNGVTKIGDYAFYGYSRLTSISIPDSITEIGSWAFYGCSELTSVSIPDSVTEIGISAFYNCSGLISVSIPDSVTEIGEYAFYGCSGLTSVSIPDSVTEIGSYAFYRCSVLTSVSIPDSVTEIGSRAFSFCIGLTSVNIPDSITKIGSHAFSFCSVLTSVSIPDSVTEIGDEAFYNCSGLTKVNITDIKSWCNILFSSPDSNPLNYANKLYINNNLITDLIIPNGVTKIGDYAFRGCSELISVSIPDSVTEIGSHAFYGCSGLTSISIPNGVTKIGSWAFSYCSVLTSVNIPDSVTEIGTSAFYGCLNIQTVFYEGNESEWDSILKSGGNENLTNAKIVYNATKKTYKFETNCDTKINDITDFALFESPIVKNGGNTFIGWYDNEALQGEPLEFPYFGDATILYAAWAGTKTVCVTTTTGEKIFISIPNYLPQDSRIILACYKDNEFVEMKSAPNKNETIYFLINSEFDSAKVMVWDAFESMVPVCDFENVNQL